MFACGCVRVEVALPVEQRNITSKDQVEEEAEQVSRGLHTQGNFHARLRHKKWLFFPFSLHEKAKEWLSWLIFKQIQHRSAQKLLSLSFSSLTAPIIFLQFHSIFLLLYSHSAGKVPFWDTLLNFPLTLQNTFLWQQVKIIFTEKRVMVSPCLINSSFPSTKKKSLTCVSLCTFSMFTQSYEKHHIMILLLWKKMHHTSLSITCGILRLMHNSAGWLGCRVEFIASKVSNILRNQYKFSSILMSR